jgi:flagellar operon protein (TIGR03826 family)
MDYMNCPRCGKLFGRLSSPICKECEKEEENLFQKVRQYIDENPNSKIADVTEALGVSVKKIMRYLREGRLEASPGMGSTLRCEKCNKPIRSGHYCDSCVIDINQEVTGIFDADRAKKGARMHTFQDIKQKTAK